MNFGSCFVIDSYFEIPLDRLFEKNASAFTKSLADKDAAAAAAAASLAAIAASQVLSIMEREKDNTDDSIYKAGLEKELLLIRAGKLCCC